MGKKRPVSSEINCDVFKDLKSLKEVYLPRKQICHNAAYVRYLVLTLLPPSVHITFLDISCCTRFDDAAEQKLCGTGNKWESDWRGWRWLAWGIYAYSCSERHFNRVTRNPCFLLARVERGSWGPSSLCHMVFRCPWTTLQTVYVDLRWYVARKSASVWLCLLFLCAHALAVPSPPSPAVATETVVSDRQALVQCRLQG